MQPFPDVKPLDLVTERVFGVFLPVDRRTGHDLKISAPLTIIVQRS